jgi:hypothetical protein
VEKRDRNKVLDVDPNLKNLAVTSTGSFMMVVNYVEPRLLHAWNNVGLKLPTLLSDNVSMNWAAVISPSSPGY